MKKKTVIVLSILGVLGTAMVFLSTKPVSSSNCSAAELLKAETPISYAEIVGEDAPVVTCQDSVLL